MQLMMLRGPEGRKQKGSLARKLAGDLGDLAVWILASRDLDRAERNRLSNFFDSATTPLKVLSSTALLFVATLVKYEGISSRVVVYRFP